MVILAKGVQVLAGRFIVLQYVASKAVSDTHTHLYVTDMNDKSNARNPVSLLWPVTVQVIFKQTWLALSVSVLVPFGLYV